MKINLQSVQHCFYVDNCLQSLPSSHEAKSLIDKMRPLLADGGFNIRQWASNDPTVIHHLPPDAKSKTSELWFSDNGDPKELTLGLQWNCFTDMLGYKTRSITYHQPTMRYIYKVLASQYDPLGYLVPFTTRAKILVQDLWKQERGWDNIIKTDSLLEKWQAWELELKNLPDIHFPRCYLPPCTNAATSESHMHVFCDASERVYGAVAYLQTKDRHDNTHVSFIMARSRIAPKRQLSIPRLELCAALSGAQLASFLSSELTIPLLSVTLWTDSTTVLSWLTSDSCRYKVFVGTRIAEIQSECFPEEFNALKTGKSISKSSKLLPLSPEYDPDVSLIRVGGRLRRVQKIS